MVPPGLNRAEILALNHTALRSTYLRSCRELFADVQLEKAMILPYSWSSKRLPVFQGEVVEYQQLTEIKGIFAV